MLSNGQVEVRKIINSFLEEYENFKKENDTAELNNLYGRVRDTFCSNDIIKNDAITSQQLGTSPYSQNYLDWLNENAVEETITSSLKEDFPTLDFPMRKIKYYITRGVEPAYMGGEKWDSTFSCLFGLAQGKRLDSFQWNSVYYDAIQFWQAGGGGHHRLLSHILFGSNQINPAWLIVYRNDFTDPLLNESLLQFDKLFKRINSKLERINTKSEYRIELAFNAESLSEEAKRKIKSFFGDVKSIEKAHMRRVINAYILGDLYQNYEKIEIDDMYCLLNNIRDLRSKPRWYRQLLIIKQKILGVNSVDIITSNVFNLPTSNKSY